MILVVHLNPNLSNISICKLSIGSVISDTVSSHSI